MRSNNHRIASDRIAIGLTAVAILTLLAQILPALL